MTASDLAAILREAGAIVHGDGNIFFTNAEKFLAAVAALSSPASQVEGVEPTSVQFDYLLNRFERASQADEPAKHGYSEHRKALYAYVRGLEQAAAPKGTSGSDALDAARYRLLRRGQRWSVVDGIGDTLRADELDTAIDAAISSKERS
jgi:hypothetical protein